MPGRGGAGPPGRARLPVAAAGGGGRRGRRRWRPARHGAAASAARRSCRDRCQARTALARFLDAQAERGRHQPPRRRDHVTRARSGGRGWRRRPGGGRFGRLLRFGDRGRFHDVRLGRGGRRMRDGFGGAVPSLAARGSTSATGAGVSCDRAPPPRPRGPVRRGRRPRERRPPRASAGCSSGATAAIGLTVLTSRGGGSEGLGGGGGGWTFWAVAGFLPLGPAPSAKMSPDGSLMPRFFAMRSTNWRATISSTVLDALLTSMPWSRFSSATISWLVVSSNSAIL